MAKKRKSDSTGLEEVDRSMYTSFCSTANSLSQLYTQSMNQQRLSFQAGERHSLEKLNDWISRQQEDGSRVNTVDIVTYLQKKLEYGSEEPATPPRSPFQSQIALHSTDGGFPVPSSPSSSFAPTTHGQGLRSGHSDHQAKNSVFSNALSSPVRWDLQQYHLSHGGVCSSNPCSNDSFMDIHDDIPGQEH